MKRKAIFLDRDGTLIEEVNFLHRVEDMQFFSYTEKAVELLKENDFLIIIVTNQSGIGREIYTETAMHSIHEAIQKNSTTELTHFIFVRICRRRLSVPQTESRNDRKRVTKF